MKPTRSAHPARRPRRPGDIRHDPDSINEDELLDEHRQAGDTEPVLCEQVWLLRARVDCPACGERTAVYAMLGRPEFEAAERSSTLLRRIAALPPELDSAVRAFSRGHWRRDRSEQEAGAHWQSHCEKCDQRIDEGFTLGADGPFQPVLYRQRVAIKALPLQGPFVLADAVCHDSPPMLAWLDWLQRRKAPAKAGTARRTAAPAR